MNSSRFEQDQQYESDEPRFGRGRGRGEEDTPRVSLNFELLRFTPPEVPAFESLGSFEEVVEVMREHREWLWALKPVGSTQLSTFGRARQFGSEKVDLKTARDRLSKYQKQRNHELGRRADSQSESPSDQLYEAMRANVEAAETEDAVRQAEYKQTWVWLLWEQFAQFQAEKPAESNPFQTNDDDDAGILREDQAKSWTVVNDHVAQLQRPLLPLFDQVSPEKSTYTDIQGTLNAWQHFLMLKMYGQAWEKKWPIAGIVTPYEQKLLQSKLGGHVTNPDFSVEQRLAAAEELIQLSDFIANFQRQLQLVTGMFDGHWMAELYKACEGTLTIRERRTGTRDTPLKAVMRAAGLESPTGRPDFDPRQLSQQILAGIQRDLDEGVFDLNDFQLPSEAELIQHPHVDEVIEQAEAWLQEHKPWVTSLGLGEIKRLERMKQWMQTALVTGLLTDNQVALVLQQLEANLDETKTILEQGQAIQEQIEKSLVIRYLQGDETAARQVKLLLLQRAIPTNAD